MSSALAFVDLQAVSGFLMGLALVAGIGVRYRHRLLAPRPTRAPPKARAPATAPAPAHVERAMERDPRTSEDAPMARLTGDVTLEGDAGFAEGVRVKGSLTLAADARVRGDVHVEGSVTLERGARADGTVRATGCVRLASGARAGAVRADGDAVLAADAHVTGALECARLVLKSGFDSVTPWESPVRSAETARTLRLDEEPLRDLDLEER